ncbi:uncharacterized protein [Arachis hypogaea]|uniref:uncharacterized protein isoform X2 n=2 Tax=Arachis TaxID=3817 RepID=UPI003B223BB3|nr:uncharacterized protein DS421_11g348450 [Arachis hypogaea]
MGTGMENKSEGGDGEQRGIPRPAPLTSLHTQPFFNCVVSAIGVYCLRRSRRRSMQLPPPPQNRCFSGRSSAVSAFVSVYVSLDHCRAAAIFRHPPFLVVTQLCCSPFSKSWLRIANSSTQGSRELETASANFLVPLLSSSPASLVVQYVDQHGTFFATSKMSALPIS